MVLKKYAARFSVLYIKDLKYNRIYVIIQTSYLANKTKLCTSINVLDSPQNFYRSI